MINTPKNIAIFGATSAIAQSTARIWAGRGSTLILCAMEADRLAQVAADMKARGATAVHTLVFDASNIESCTRCASEVINLGCDVALIAHGILTDQSRCQKDANANALALNINFTSYAVIGEALAAHFEAKKSGTLVMISSVAGDRGRASNYLYGAAKAGVTAIASGLRGRLNKVGAHVITIKPGFVNTPMTAHLKKGALFVSPDVIAKCIVSGVDHNKSVVYAPGFWRIIMGILLHVPEKIFHKLPI